MLYLKKPKMIKDDPDMEDWREIEAVWDGGNAFEGLSRSGLKVMMGAPEGFSPMEMVLISMAGCTGLDVSSILKKMRQPLEEMKVRIRGLRRDEHPRFYTQIEVEYLFTGTGLDSKAIEQAIALSEDKYCSVSAMLRESAAIKSSYRIITKEDATFSE